ncbi:energy transducer TonB [Microbulbifer sp.]|uniref:energy transducer TonB n=1 Tax=Microbulbifer sp. TaxID=1908541 RepID=UPI0025875FE9|nr:energy transducer TonB [Microbulbifer sp.]
MLTLPIIIQAGTDLPATPNYWQKGYSHNREPEMKLRYFALALPLLAAGMSVDAAPRLSGVKQQSTVEQYASILNNHTMKNIRYPARAERKRREGNVILRITIDKSGQVKDIEVVEESNYSSLNREALRSVERSNPYPAIPANLGIDSYSFTIPIRFKLNG